MIDKTRVLVCLLGFAMAQNVVAELIYTDVVPDRKTQWNTTVNEFGFVDCLGETAHVDLDANGVVDLRLVTSCDTQMSGLVVNVDHRALAPAGVIVDENGVARLDAGTVIDSEAILGGDLFDELLVAESEFFTDGNWADTRHRFVGMRLEIDGSNHFGWVRLSVDRSGITVHDYAYETRADTPIVAGQGFPSFIIPIESTRTISAYAETIDLTRPPPDDLIRHSQMMSFYGVEEFNVSVSAAGANARLDSMIQSNGINATGIVNAIGDDLIMDSPSAWASTETTLEFALTESATVSLALRYDGSREIGGSFPDSHSNFEFLWQGPEGDVYHSRVSAGDCVDQNCDFLVSTLTVDERVVLPAGQYRIEARADASAGRSAEGTFDLSLQATAADPVKPLDDGTLLDLQLRTVYVHEVLNSWLGDSNLDGEFDSSDLVLVFSAGEYEDLVEGNSSWVTGDWSGDREFDSSDLVLAMQDGGFEQGRRTAALPVPEPGITGLAVLSLVFLLRERLA